MDAFGLDFLIDFFSWASIDLHDNGFISLYCDHSGYACEPYELGDEPPDVPRDLNALGCLLWTVSADQLLSWEQSKFDQMTEEVIGALTHTVPEKRMPLLSALLKLSANISPGNTMRDLYREAHDIAVSRGISLS